MKRIVTALVLVALLDATWAHPVRGQYPISSSDQSDDGDAYLGGLLLVACGLAGSTPIWGPFVLIGDNYSERAQFLEYPYKGDAIGNLVFCPEPSAETYDWTLRAETNYAENFSRFSRLDAGMQLEWANRRSDTRSDVSRMCCHLARR